MTPSLATCTRHGVPTAVLFSWSLNQARGANSCIVSLIIQSGTGCQQLYCLAGRPIKHRVPTAVLFSWSPNQAPGANSCIV
ncbi:hypothetical protein RRG08_048572 [Elysia crispata]|uniref:Uncharacterized protein n=1 Tax=Elysia crispata TaxID=231223 RepID=A0AAE1B5N4_9GAST|nr:hypothetical protein RRG08_048572 [Elysia crispata]